MFAFAPISPRIKALDEKRQWQNNGHMVIDSERTRIYTEYYKAHEEEPNNLKRAHCLYQWAKDRTLTVEEEDFFVGQLGKSYRALQHYVDWKPDGMMASISGSDEDFRAGWQKEGGFCYMSDADRAIFLNACQYWRGRSISDRMEGYIPEKLKTMAGDGCTEYYFRRPWAADRPQGHYCANYDKVVKKGFGFIRKEAQAHLDAMEGRLYGDLPRKYNFYRTTLIVCDAFAMLANRYAALCREKAEVAKTKERKAELLNMADGLENIAEHPARNTWEGLQAIILYEIMLLIDGSQHGLTLGRIDQYVGHLSDADLASGALTQEQLQELSDAFFLRLHDFVLIPRLGGADLMSQLNLAGGNQYVTGGQHFSVGGVDQNGNDATNSMTICLLQTAGRMCNPDPSISCRIHKGTPEIVWQLALESSKISGGVPTLENDDVIIPALLKRGLSLEDARNYCIIGCVEPCGCGTEYPASGGDGSESFFNLIGCIVMAMHNGTNPATGYDGGLKTGYLPDYPDFEAFRQAYLDQLKYFLDWQISGHNMFEVMYQEYFPCVAASATFEGCMESGKDVTAGGAKYNSCGITVCGVGNVADCLMAVKMAFDGRLGCTVQELYDAVCANWEGYEELHQRVIDDMPHYGNNNEEVDELAAWTMQAVCDHMHQAEGMRGHMSAGTFTMTVHLDYGMRTAATPDGRTKGSPIAEAISPRQGFDKHGPTAYLSSASKLPHTDIDNGNQLNIRLSPSAVAGEQGTRKLRQLFESYFNMGGMQVQFNVVSTDALHDAQANPDKYKNLIVRIAGFSAYFVEMPKPLQDDFITRTECQL